MKTKRNIPGYCSLPRRGLETGRRALEVPVSVLVGRGVGAVRGGGVDRHIELLTFI